MLTPQEVSTRAFTKAVMGGYNMAMVDEFLDQLTEDYTALYKENAALKAKLKVLADKIEEYRATEDSMRATLLTAQRMADTMVKEAEQKRDSMLAESRMAAEQSLSSYRMQIEEQEARLKLGKQELAEFVRTARETCAKQMAFLEQLPEAELAAAPAAPAAEEKTKEEPVAPEQAQVASEVQEILSSFEAAAAAEPEPEAEEPEAPAEEYVPMENPFETKKDEEPLEATRRIDLSDLKFGRNYTSEE